MTAGDIWLRTNNYVGHFGPDGSFVFDRVIPFPELDSVAQGQTARLVHNGTHLWLNNGDTHLYRVNPATLVVDTVLQPTDESESWGRAIAMLPDSVLVLSGSSLALAKMDDAGTFTETILRYDLFDAPNGLMSIANGTDVAFLQDGDDWLGLYQVDADTYFSIAPGLPTGHPDAFPLAVAPRLDGTFWVSWVDNADDTPVFTEHDSDGTVTNTVTPPCDLPTTPVCYAPTTAIDVDDNGDLIVWINTYDLETTGPSHILRITSGTSTITTLNDNVPDPYGMTDFGFIFQSGVFVERGAVEPDPDPEPTPAVGGRVSKECVLGCPSYRVMVTSRCGQQTICELDNISDMEYGRVMDDTSQAIIVVNLPGDGEESCCECLGNVRSWIHSVIIYRDDELVWGPGPVTNVLYKREQVAITARDVTAWLDGRLVHNDLDYFDADPLVIAQGLIADAMYQDDPCGIADKVITYPPDRLGMVDRSYTSEDPTQYSGDALRELARTLIDFTVIGDQILMGEPLSFGPFFTLTSDDFQVDLEIEERGLETGTRWVVQGDAALGAAGGIDPYYGLIEQLAEESSIEDDDQAALAARNRLQASNPAPLYVNVPDGARLSPDAAVCFKQLVPGTLVNLNITNMCRDVVAQLRLTAVSVHVGESGDEEVGVSLSPIGTGFGEAT